MVALQVDWARDHGLTDRLALLAAHGFTEGAPADRRRPAPVARLPPIAPSGSGGRGDAGRCPDRSRPAGARDVDAKVHGRTAAAPRRLGRRRRASSEPCSSAGADPQVLDDEHGSTPLGWPTGRTPSETAVLLRPVTRAG